MLIRTPVQSAAACQHSVWYCALVGVGPVVRPDQSAQHDRRTADARPSTAEAMPKPEKTVAASSRPGRRASSACRLGHDRRGYPAASGRMVGVTVEATALGHRPDPRRRRCPPPGRPVRPRQRPLAGRLRDPGRPRHRRRVPVAVRPRRGTGPRSDHRGRRGRARRHGHRPAAHRRPVRELHGRGRRRAARRSAAARRAGDDRRRRPTRRRWPRCSARCSAPGSAAVRASTSTPTRRTPPLPGAPQPVRPRAARRVVLPRRAARRDPGRLPAPHRRGCSRSSTARSTPATRRDTPARIVALETKLAAAHWDVVKRRDADLTYNLRTFADLPAEAPGFDWAGWVDRAGHLTRSGRPKSWCASPTT